MTGYELSRNWFDWIYENPEKISPNHTALYFFIIEHYNRMGQPVKFGLPMEMAKSAIGIKNYRTYSKTFEDLIEWGFIDIIQRSKNQYSSNIIAIAENTKAHTKALSKALQKHSQKQVHGIVGINKPIIDKPITKKPIIKDDLILPFDSLEFKSKWDILCSQKKWIKKSNSAKKESLILLEKYTEKDAIQMMQNAIAGEYQGLFEIKGSKQRPEHLRNKLIELPF
jgi:hypothetical protein